LGVQYPADPDGEVHRMKTLTALFLAILASCLAPCSRAQTLSASELREQAKENEIKQDELVNLEKETARALQMSNALLFRRVYGEDFIAILPSGEVLDKNRWIAAIENPPMRYTSFIVSDIRVRMFEDTAVVTCLWSARGIANGHAMARQWRVTHVYIYGQRGWQVIASQETLLPG
jgi:ketosteroid isomerase-like protein